MFTSTMQNVPQENTQIKINKVKCCNSYYQLKKKYSTFEVNQNDDVCSKMLQ